MSKATEYQILGLLFLITGFVAKPVGATLQAIMFVISIIYGTASIILRFLELRQL